MCEFSLYKRYFGSKCSVLWALNFRIWGAWVQAHLYLPIDDVYTFSCSPLKTEKALYRIRKTDNFFQTLRHL